MTIHRAMVNKFVALKKLSLLESNVQLSRLKDLYTVSGYNRIQIQSAKKMAMYENFRA
jgi:hypothetical protein